MCIRDSSWPADLIVATLCSMSADGNLFAGVNLQDDEEVIQIDKWMNSSALYFFKPVSYTHLFLVSASLFHFSASGLSCGSLLAAEPFFLPFLLPVAAFLALPEAW